MKFLLIAALSFTFFGAQNNEPKINSISWNIGLEDNLPLTFLEFNDSTDLQFRKSYWIKTIFSVYREDDYVLIGGRPYMKNLVFYGDHFERLSSGNLHEMHLKAGTYTLYIYYPFKDFQDKNEISLDLIQSSNYYKSQLKSKAYHEVFIGVLLFICLLSLSFFIVSKAKDWLYFHYSWYLFSIIFFFSYQYGMLGSFWPSINSVSPYLIWVFSFTLTLSYLYFAQSFLYLKKTDPLVNQIINYGKFFILSVVIVELISYIIQYDVLHNLIYKSVVVLVQATAFPFIIYRVYRQKTTLSWILFIGAVVLGATTLGGQIASIVKATNETNLYIQFALILEVFIFSIGIGLRMWIMAEEKRKVQATLLNQMEENVAIQQEYTFELENKVKDRTADLQLKNEEKDILLKEIHHRVKNNLQTIASLLSIQLRRLKSQPAKIAIEDSMNRVKVMGLIHKFLYQKDTYTSIDLNEFVNQLFGMLIDTSNPKTKVKQIVKVDSIKLDIERAINIGLILNELVTNSIKHAFTHLDEPVLTFRAEKKADKVCILFSDNGNLGKVDVFSNAEGFGWKLINSLIISLDGEMEYSVNDGFEVIIKFPYIKP